jgi:twitching motility protein PilT
VEYRFRPDKSLIHQREVGRDTRSFASGLRAALREDPDVIMVGELRDEETMATALTAAETGHLVLGTLHTSGAIDAVHRVLDAFPDRSRQVQT